MSPTLVKLLSSRGNGWSFGCYEFPFCVVHSFDHPTPLTINPLLLLSSFTLSTLICTLFSCTSTAQSDPPWFNFFAPNLILLDLIFLTPCYVSYRHNNLRRKLFLKHRFSSLCPRFFPTLLLGLLDAFFPPYNFYLSEEFKVPSTWHSKKNETNSSIRQNFNGLGISIVLDEPNSVYSSMLAS